MEKSQADADSTGVCEKIYNAVAGNPAFRAIHRKSGRSQSSMLTDFTDSNQLALQNAQNKTVPARVNIHIQLEQSMAATKQKEIMAKMPVSAHKGGGITIRPSQIAFSEHSKRKEDAAKPLPQTTKPNTVFVHIQGHEDDVAPKLVDNVQTSVASGHDQLKKIASNNKFKPAGFSSLQEKKIKQESAASPNIIVIQGRGQEMNVSTKVEPPKTGSHMPVQELQPNEKLTVKTMSRKIDHPNNHDKSDHPEQIPANNQKFSDYINYVKDKMKTSSNVCEETANATPATRSNTRRDSFNDRVANFINRAKKNIRTTSFVGRDT